MAFNSNTYHANKLARQSRESMAKARELKAKIASGAKFYDWERPQEAIKRHVDSALLWSRMSRLYRSMGKRR